MNSQGKYNFYAGSICAVLLFVCANAYSAYNPCIERPQFLNPKFAKSEFAKPQFDKPKMEIPPPIEKKIIVQDPYVKPVFERPMFVLPKFQDCAAIKEKKTPFEKALIDFPGSPKSAAIATESNKKGGVTAINSKTSETKSNPNEFYFYKIPANNTDDCCGAQTDNQVKDSAPNQVVSAKKIEIR